MPPPAKFVLSAFADEISPSLAEQVRVLEELGVSGLDLRSVDGVNVLDLDNSILYKVHESCQAAGLHVQSIGSPVNKIPYDVLGQGRELDRLNKAIKIAQHINVKRIRIFAPEVPKELEQELAPKILDWMREQKDRADAQGVMLLLENDARYYSAFPHISQLLFDKLGGPSFKAAFDFANTVLIGYRPKDWFPWLLPHLDTLHIKDAVEREGKVVPAGQGDGEIGETLGYLIKEGWNGPLTLEPHLQAAGAFGGFSGEQLFREAVGALRSVLAEVGAEG